MSIFTKIKDAIFHRAEAAPSAQPAGSAAAQPGPGTVPASAAPSTGAAPSGSSPEPQAPSAAPSAPGSPASTPSAPAASTPAPSPAAPSTPVDVAAIMDKAVKDSGQTLDWRKSIVDTMKALHLDSSLSERKELAHELGYSGDTNDSATMNVWLQKALMKKLAENGGRVPAELQD